MGKGKRNRQLHFEDKQTNPQKYRERKGQLVMPTWAKRTIAVALVLVLVAGIVLGALINSGLFLRNRVLVKSATGENDMNQQMATFLLWQTMYQQAYYEWYYTSWGMYEDTYNITKTYSSAASYGIAVASAYTNDMLRNGIEGIADYLIELVAGADKALDANLDINDDDTEDIEEIKTWLKNTYLNSGYMGTYKKFLKEVVGEGITVKDVEAAARLVVLHNKYSSYAKLEMDNDPTEDILQAFIEKNPAGHFEVSYQQYKNASPEFLKTLFKDALAEKYESEYKALLADEAEYDTLLGDLIKNKNTTSNKSADNLANELHDKLIGKEPKPWDEAIGDATVNTATVQKPADDAEEEDIDAFQSVLFAKETIKVGGFYTAHDDGTSYEIKVTGGNATDGWQISYVTFEDSNYYKAFRAAKKEIEELQVSADDFRKLVVQTVVDESFNKLVMNKFLVEDIVKTAKEKLDNAYLTDSELDTLVTTLQIAETEYLSENRAEIPAEIADYIFDTHRKDKDTKVIKSGDKYYIVNVFKKPVLVADTTDKYTVKAGWVEYDYKLDSAIESLGLEMKQYIKNAKDELSTKFPAAVAEWAYATDRQAGDVASFDGDSSFYFAYIESAPTTVTIGTEEFLSVKVAIKEYQKNSEDTTLIEALNFKKLDYTSDNTKIPAEIKAWLFDEERQAGDAKLIKVTDGTNVKFYVAYAFSAATVDGENKKIEAAFEAVSLSSKQYVNNDTDPLAKDFSAIASWAYNSKNAAGSTEIFTIDNTVYLAYLNKAITSETVGETSYSYVSVGMKAYTLADAPKSDWIVSQKGLLLQDLINDEIGEKDFDEIKSSDDKAKALYELLAGENGDKTKWDELVADLEVKNDIVKKPASDSSTTTAVQDVLYTGATVKVGDIFQVNDNGTSYVLKITEVDGTTYKYDYVSYTDDEYYEFFRALKSTLTASFAKDATDLTYPDSLSTATNSWLFKGEYDEEAKKYVFDREVNDVMHFAVTTTTSSNSTPIETGFYNVYIITKIPTQDKDDAKSVYGGYLLFKTKSEADAALKALKGKKGFDLWHAFSALSVTTGEGDKAKVTNATVNSAFAKADFWEDETNEVLNSLGAWLFSDDRKQNDLAVIKGTDGYYLAYYYTSEQTWTRKAKDSWLEEQMKEEMKSIVKGYKIEQKIMDKLGKKEEETTAAKK